MISGLQYFPTYISAEQEQAYLTAIDEAEWDCSLKRRVQHYGYRYDYKARKTSADLYIGTLPTWLQTIAERLHTDQFISRVPDQVIINEYAVGQGISAHIDCEPCFGDCIFSLSLGSSAEMQFTHPHHEKQTLLLAPRSLLLMSGEARYDWKHAIPARKKDHGVMRQRRISMTFRKVLQP